MYDNKDGDKDPDFFDNKDKEFIRDDLDEEDMDDDDDEEELDEEDEDEFVRINFTIPKSMRKKVKKYAKMAGVSVSELIRGSLDGIMALGEAGVDFAEQLEKGFKEGLEELEGLTDDIDDKFDFEEFGRQMEDFGKVINEKVQATVGKSLAKLQREFPHLRRIKHPPHPPHPPEPESWAEKVDPLVNLRKLEKMKELLDKGIITQEDYNTKKQKILDNI